jgi:hypothetical protein
MATLRPSKRGEDISENVPCQKNKYSKSRENWGDRWYGCCAFVADFYDNSEQGTKHDNDRE